MEECEYLLQIWGEKPNDPSILPSEYWSVHVTNAYTIPRIGEDLKSSSGFGGFNLYRVFGVRHNLGEGLAELLTESREVIKSRTPEGRKGLVHVLAYRV